ncbi:MAG: PHP domain-containing protein [Clostridium sp.]|uniref:PHP domain-containing protein n=1 Tax=Clostridium sp. TaxID=1506 RepID=UPI003EE7124C
MDKYFNYHKHTSSSNIITMDSACTNEDYAERSIELEHEWLSSCEHGGTINWVDCYLTAKKHGLKYIHVGEFYFVRDRIVEEDGKRDNLNTHLILVAKTRRAMEEMNYIMSEANMTGYYYKPRIDLELLRKLPKGEVICTTACVGSFLRDYPNNNSRDTLEQLIDIFGENLFLEVQAHNTEKQKRYNELMIALADKHGLKLIAGTDSHMIKKESVERTYLLHSKGLIYDDEEGWSLYFPNRSEFEDMFIEQGVLSSVDIKEAINNTLLLTESEEIVIDTKMKVPTIFPDKSREWKLGKLKELIFEGWESYKKDVPKNKWNTYIKEMMEEFNIIEYTNIEDYFITNYYLIKKGIEYGGVLTKSGRGSGTSFLLNKMLGFTSVDRLKAKVPMLRDRFLGIARVLENNSCADIDHNLSNRDAFVRAQSELLGEGSSYLMTAYGTLGLKSAFKMYCRAKNIDISVADELSKHITSYTLDKKHNEYAKIEDYIKDKEHLKLVEESKSYMGIIDSFSAHPCSYCLSNEDLRRTFGLLKSPAGDMVVNITGGEAEKLGYLKNDLLIVSVVGMNDALYKRVGIKQFESNELYDKVQNDEKVWDLYAKGHTVCLNQVESSGTVEKVKAFKPKSVEDLCNFVAVIRPGSASIYKSFEKRELFKYDIEVLDKLLQGDFLTGSWIIYQEQIMQLMEWLEFPESETYAIMKAISKKKISVIESVKERFEEKLMEEMIKDILDKEELK